MSSRLVPTLLLLALSLLPAAPAHARDRHAPRLTRVTRVDSGALVLRFSERVRVAAAHRLRVTPDGRVRRSHRFSRRLRVRTGRQAGWVTVRSGAVRDRAGNRGRSAKFRVPAYGAGPLVSAPASQGVSPGEPISAADDASLRSVPAAAVADTVGVNVHMSYFDTAYADFDTLRGRLRDLGVRYVRDSACASCEEQQRRLEVLASDGVKIDFLMRGPRASDTIADSIAAIERRFVPLGAVASLEGANEWDLSGDPAWADSLRRYQDELYAAAKASPALRDVPVLAPSLVRPASYAALGDVSPSSDLGNIHPYSGGDTPTAKLPRNVELSQVTAGAAMPVVTETGYHNAVATNSDHLPTSERAAGLYVPRLFLDNYVAGVPRTYLYELVDEWADPAHSDSESNFGLLRNDYSPKPAYTSLQQLMALLTKAPTAARDVPVEVSGGPDLRRLLVQQDRTHAVLFLWRDAKVWDPVARRDLEVERQPVDVNLGRGVTAQASELTGSADAAETAMDPSHLRIGGAAVAVTLTLPG